MKSFRKMSAAVALAGGLLAAVPALAAPGKTCRARGEDAFAAWTQGLYRQVGKHFSPRMTRELTPTVLQEMWAQLQAQVGKFKALGRFSPRSVAGQDVMVAPMTFANMHLVAVFACDADDRIAGMQVLDPAKVPGLETSAPASH